jgi:hypothetical protein
MLQNTFLVWFPTTINARIATTPRMLRKAMIQPMISPAWARPSPVSVPPERRI